ncbi:MAG TPA: hypothetical protein VG651_19215 [Stellaceae bacterium]|uniref:hypothetical protein n=1 Tax=Sphingomonas sp. GlSt437 TaxID=3389970 RepID=UPI002C1B9F82|nr:hypothetical protein [Stellaceae bacterium]
MGEAIQVHHRRAAAIICPASGRDVATRSLNRRHDRAHTAGVAMMMSPGLRKLALTVHVTLSVGLLGTIAAFAALALSGIVRGDDLTVRVVYPAMKLIADDLVIPFAFGALVTGVIQSVGTSWGLFKHYWVLFKLLLTAFATIILLLKLPLIDDAARLATETTLHQDQIHIVGVQLVVHAIAGMLVLFVPVVLSICKPKGMTRYGLQKQHNRSTLPHGKKGGQRTHLGAS